MFVTLNALNGRLNGYLHGLNYVFAADGVFVVREIQRKALIRERKLCFASTHFWENYKKSVSDLRFVRQVVMQQVGFDFCQ